jgi:hypothetical protein
MWLYSGDLSSDARGALQTLLPLGVQAGGAWERLLQSREVSQQFSVSCYTVTPLGQEVKELAPVLHFYWCP